MNIIENIIINAILVTFPILVHQFYVLYNKNINKEKTEILFSLTLFISLYFSMYFKQFLPTDYQFISIILPIIIGYLENKTLVTLIISTITLEYLVLHLNYNIYITSLFFICLYILYLLYIKSNKSKSFFINISVLIVSINLIINNMINNNKDIITFLIQIVLYTIIIKMIDKAINEGKNIINLHMNIKEFEKEKSIKLSLFKLTHEIKNPITIIKGYLDLYNCNDEIKSKKYIAIMKEEITKTVNLLDDFLEFSKIKVNKSLNNIDDLIINIKEVLIPLFNTKKINYDFIIEKNIIVNIDYIRIKQVLINLIKNAIEACTPNKGYVVTSIYTDEDYMYIFIKDNGEGMSKEVMDNIASPFYTTKEKGTGLGVSLSKEIIESHNGELTFTSTIKKGTTFKIIIPL